MLKHCSHTIAPPCPNALAPEPPKETFTTLYFRYIVGTDITEKHLRNNFKDQSNILVSVNWYFLVRFYFG